MTQKAKELCEDGWCISLTTVFIRLSEVYDLKVFSNTVSESEDGAANEKWISMSRMV